VSLLVHCVTRADQSSAARTVVWQDLAAVVSEWRTPTQQDALAHLQMLSELVVAGPVVPLKYGTTATDEEAVRAEVLASSAPRLRAHLDRLDGLVEVHNPGEEEMAFWVAIQEGTLDELDPEVLTNFGVSLEGIKEPGRVVNYGFIDRFGKARRGGELKTLSRDAEVYVRPRHASVVRIAAELEGDAALLHVTQTLGDRRTVVGGAAYLLLSDRVGGGGRKPVN